MDIGRQIMQARINGFDIGSLSNISLILQMRHRIFTSKIRPRYANICPSILLFMIEAKRRGVQNRPVQTLVSCARNSSKAKQSKVNAASQRAYVPLVSCSRRASPSIRVLMHLPPSRLAFIVCSTSQRADRQPSRLHKSSQRSWSCHVLLSRSCRLIASLASVTVLSFPVFSLKCIIC